MKRIYFLILSSLLISQPHIWGQDSFVEAYAKYRPYHYQTPRAWNRIRREIADPGKTIWSLLERESRFMYLTGTWNGLIPSPTPDNTYVINGLEEVGKMYQLVLNPNAHGYIIYPIWLEEDIKFTADDKISNQIITKGFMNTLVTDIVYNAEKNLERIIFNTDSLSEDTTLPVVYGTDSKISSLLSEQNYNLYNVKRYYCYFDNRPDSVRNKIKYQTEVTRDFDHELFTLYENMQHSDLSYVMVPYWMTDLYTCLPQAESSKIHRFGYMGYVLNPINGSVELNNNWSTVNMMDFQPYSEINYDLVVYCGDAQSTNWFLSNYDSHEQLIYTIFEPEKGMINRKDFNHKPSGINLYFPEFDFKEKRALKQLVKSLSLVIDSFTVDGEKIYKELDLSLTFPGLVLKDHSGFISGLQCFVDTVYFADYNANGLSPRIRYSDGKVDTSSLISRLKNSFYLFRIPYKKIKPGINDGNLTELVKCDYNTGSWGLFFFIDSILALAIILFFILKFTSPLIYRYMEIHPTAMVLIIITLIMETAVFFYFMVEALSPQVIFFDMKKDTKHYLFLTAIPILPITIYFLIRNIYKDRPIP